MLQLNPIGIYSSRQLIKLILVQKTYFNPFRMNIKNALMRAYILHFTCSNECTENVYLRQLKRVFVDVVAVRTNSAHFYLDTSEKDLHAKR